MLHIPLIAKIFYFFQYPFYYLSTSDSGPSILQKLIPQRLCHSLLEKLIILLKPHDLWCTVHSWRDWTTFPLLKCCPQSASVSCDSLKYSLVFDLFFSLPFYCTFLFSYFEMMTLKGLINSMCPLFQIYTLWDLLIIIIQVTIIIYIFSIQTAFCSFPLYLKYWVNGIMIHYFQVLLSLCSY